MAEPAKQPLGKTRNQKAEIRKKAEIRSPNPEAIGDRIPYRSPVPNVFFFGLRPSDFFRISAFGFRPCVLSMLIFDQLKRNDPQLRAMTLVVLGGLGILLAGLWWVQVVSARDYQESLETQSFRTVRIPAVRGSILDCNHNVLAENRPTYNVSLYLEELRKPFDAAYFQELARARERKANEQAQLEQRLGRR